MIAERPSPASALRLPLTKFLAPRPRRDVVPRDELLGRLRALSRELPVTLVCAPAGSGKTTLMAQLAADVAAAAAGDEAMVWVALDESDDDPARLLATLVRSLGPLDLAWDMDPAALVANVTGSGTEARAVLAGVVNALCTSASARLTWILDDVQRLQDPGAVSVLDALIERLPGHVGLVLGSRTEPALPLARLRAHGELGELESADLRFDECTVAALAAQRFGDTVPLGLVRDALDRTQGWAVGVNLLLAARLGEQARTSPASPAGSRALFDFLAQEVLDDLPPALREFAIDVSVLPELSPSRCAAVTGRDEAAAREALEDLVRRHLFLSVVDDTEPVLRLHDLFREFLLARLARQPAAYRQTLHARAAAAEPLPERAIHHWLDAGRWPEAVELIAREGLRLAAEGATAGVERWIDRLPPEVVEAEPRLALLRTECAWSRWDWERVLRFAAPAAEGLALTGDLPGRLRAQLLLAAALGATGRLAEREALTEATLALDLPPLDAAQFHLQRAWSDFSLGRTDRVAGHLARMNELVATDPVAIAPVVAQTFNCHFGGLPGVTEACLRYVALCDEAPRPAALPWHSTPVVAGAWAALWQGRREGALQALERGAQIQHAFGKVRYVMLDATQLQALLHAAQGEFRQAREHLAGLLEDLDSSDADGLRRAWQRPYRGVLARTLWMAMDAPALAAEAARLEGPARVQEWPLVPGAIATVQGQAALLAGDLASARALLERAVALHARYPAPAFYADPRVALAEAHRRRGDEAAARDTFRPVLQAAGRDGTPGRLLLEPAPVVRALLALCPADSPEALTAAAVRRMLALWAPVVGAPSPSPASSGPGLSTAMDESPAVSRPPSATASSPGPATGAIASRLTDREREVMELVARGLSNKQLARELALSAHTVKRHLANILDKLDCDNRVQAADLWRSDAA